MATVHLHPSHPLARRDDTHATFHPPGSDTAPSNASRAVLGTGLVASVAVIAAALLFAVL